MDEHEAPGTGQDLNWLLDDLASRVEHFRKAVILSPRRAGHCVLLRTAPG